MFRFAVALLGSFGFVKGKPAVGRLGLVISTMNIVVISSVTDFLMGSNFKYFSYSLKLLHLIASVYIINS